jgi:hypothetical protein
MRGVNDVQLNREVLANEVRWIRVVRVDTPDPSGTKEHVPWALLPEEAVHRLRIRQLEFCPCAQQQVATAAGFEPPCDGGADEAAMTGDENGVVSVHR